MNDYIIDLVLFAVENNNKTRAPAAYNTFRNMQTLFQIVWGFELKIFTLDMCLNIREISTPNEIWCLPLYRVGQHETSIYVDQQVIQVQVALLLSCVYDCTLIRLYWRTFTLETIQTVTRLYTSLTVCAYGGVSFCARYMPYHGLQSNRVGFFCNSLNVWPAIFVWSFILWKMVRPRSLHGIVLSANVE